jgi:cytochrome P450
MAFYRDKQFSKAAIEARRYVDRFVNKAIDHRASLDRGQDIQESTDKLADNHYVFLNALAKQTLDKTELTDQLLNILLAGRDSTTSLLSITFFMLARHPDIWNKLLAEVQTLEGRKPSFEELNSMTYLTWVLNESKHHHALKIMLLLTDAMWSSPPLPRCAGKYPHGK